MYLPHNQFTGFNTDLFKIIENIRTCRKMYWKTSS
jgi:hypothetical protein